MGGALLDFDIEKDFAFFDRLAELFAPSDDGGWLRRFSDRGQLYSRHLEPVKTKCRQIMTIVKQILKYLVDFGDGLLSNVGIEVLL